MRAHDVREQLRALADPVRAAGQMRFFKTGKGQYGEGDVFWGIRNPDMRALVRQWRALPLEQAEVLLADAVHEVRLAGLLILVEQFRKAGEEQRQAIIDLYLRRTDRINNWDLVDLTAPMLGQWLQTRDRDILRRMAASPNMWEQRIAVVATISFIRQGDFVDILALCRLLLEHPHDLMHKAMGWMLREAGKRDKGVLEDFLSDHGAAMPRTMLRYAIERFPEDERKAWLARTRSAHRVRAAT